MTATAPARDEITGVILAGGRARRLGGLDKGLHPCAGRPLVEWTIAALAPQVGHLLINANRSLAAYQGYGLPVVGDLTADFPGPLAGIASAMAAARTPWIAVVPCDTPLLPPELVARLAAALAHDAGELALAHDGRRLQPLHALLPVALAPALTAFSAAGGRKAEAWLTGRRYALADFSDQAVCFSNLNTPADAADLDARLRARLAEDRGS